MLVVGVLRFVYNENINFNFEGLSGSKTAI